MLCYFKLPMIGLWCSYCHLSFETFVPYLPHFIAASSFQELYASSPQFNGVRSGGNQFNPQSFMYERERDNDEESNDGYAKHNDDALHENGYDSADEESNAESELYEDYEAVADPSQHVCTGYSVAVLRCSSCPLY